MRSRRRCVLCFYVSGRWATDPQIIMWLQAPAADDPEKDVLVLGEKNFADTIAKHKFVLVGGLSSCDLWDNLFSLLHGTDHIPCCAFAYRPSSTVRRPCRLLCCLLWLPDAFLGSVTDESPRVLHRMCSTIHLDSTVVRALQGMCGSNPMSDVIWCNLAPVITTVVPAAYAHAEPCTPLRQGCNCSEVLQGG